VNSATRFDERYYQRFYRDPATRATTHQVVRRQAAFVAAYARHLGLRVRRILDIGCGLGWMLAALQNEFPKARCVGVEYSEHLCATQGWQRGSVSDFVAAVPFDLVVCHDVLPSLGDRGCAAAIDNLARLCRGALYLGALTAEDWQRCDQARTDRDVYLRPAAWYRRRLAKHFDNAGGGVFLKRPLDLPLWALETL
jgi:2-polyprenyl-3-methyl-5-hydroxy-6-metoxy-1,4-benzoquinol methylase